MQTHQAADAEIHFNSDFFNGIGQQRSFERAFDLGSNALL
jgi:hypothetical protein